MPLNTIGLAAEVMDAIAGLAAVGLLAHARKKTNSFKQPQLIICGDIGGTNARMQMWQISSEGAHKPVMDCRYPSRNFDGLEPLLRKFMIDCGLPLAKSSSYSGPTVAACCVAICGAVADEQRQCGPCLPEQGPTGWGIDTVEVQKSLSWVLCKLCIVNDFVAVGFGLTDVAVEDVVTIYEPKGWRPKSDGVMAAVGAGTGLGAVFLVQHSKGGEHIAMPSEGGMCEFHPRTDEEWALRQWLVKRDGSCTVEGVCSGPGLVNVYQYLHEQKGGRDVLEGISAEEASRHAAKVVEGAKGSGGSFGAKGCDGVCLRAIDLFIEVLAGHCRDTCLHMLPEAGLFLAGGIPPKLKERILKVMPSCYVDDPVMGDFISLFPLYLVTNDDLGLAGSKVRAVRLLREL